MSLPRKQHAWEEWLKQAEDYQKAVGGRDGKPCRFQPSVQYNLIALALEGYVMAMAGYHGKLPHNHTITDLIQAWEAVAPLNPEIKTVLLKHEDAQSLCSLDDYHRRDPTVEELKEMLDAVRQLGRIAKTSCVKKKSHANPR